MDLVLTRGGNGSKIPKIKLTSFVNGPLFIMQVSGGGGGGSSGGGGTTNAPALESGAESASDAGATG